MKNFLCVFVLYVFCFVGVSFGQTKQPKVIKYFAPKYPALARATHTTGEVIISVKIDKDGNVISSKAESGHPFLLKISEDIVKEWIFAKHELSQQELKISFVYVITVNKNIKNNYKNTTYKIKFRKPYHLEIRATEYPRIDV